MINFKDIPNSVYEQFKLNESNDCPMIFELMQIVINKMYKIVEWLNNKYENLFL